MFINTIIFLVFIIIGIISSLESSLPCLHVSFSGLHNLRSVFWSSERFRIVGWSHGETRISHFESLIISNILNSLNLASSINIAVSSTHSTIGVTNLVLD